MRCPKPVTVSVTPYWPEYATCATVEWTFGDGSAVVTANSADKVSHTYSTAGTYRVKASIKTPNGYTGATETVVSVAHGVLVWSGATFGEGTTATINVTRTNTSTATSMDWSIDGAPADVTPNSGTVSFAAGQSLAKIDISSVNDALYKGTRTYTLRGAAPTGGFMAGGPVQLQILDDDYSVLDYAQKPVRVSENAGVAIVVVTRTGDSSVPVSVQYEVSRSSRNVATFGTLSFAAGETSRAFNVVILDDAIWNPHGGGGQITLSSPTNGARFPTHSWWWYTSLQIDDDEPRPSVTVEDIAHSEGDDGFTDVTFTVVASQPLDTGLYYTLSPGSATRGVDYLGHSGVIWLSGKSAQLHMRILGDTKIENDETVQLILRPYYSNTQITMPPPATLTIINDDAGFGPDNVRLTPGETTSLQLNVGPPVTAPLTIPLTNSRPDLVRVPASVTIPAGQAQTRVTVEGLRADPSSFDITAGVPADRGGPLSVSGKVYEAMQLAFDPASVRAFTGRDVPVRVILTPAPGRELELGVNVHNRKIVAAPASVTIAPDGTGTIALTALQEGETQLAIRVPDASGDTVFLPIVVTTAPDAATLASLTPATGPSAGGTQFTAHGSRLTSDCTIAFGGVPAGPVTVTGDTIAGVTPAHAPGTVDVGLTCGAATYVLANGFTYLDTAPTLSSIAPTFGSTAGGTLVRASGSDFKSGCWMFFGGVAASGVRIDSNTTLTAIAPPRAAAGLVETSVRCGNHTATLPASFAYSTAQEPAASIISVDPLVGAPGEPVTITGSRFRDDDRIRFDETAATILRTKSDEQIVRIPELPLGMSSITITDTLDRATTTGPIFLIVEPLPPQVARVQPSATLAGSDLVLEGRAFRPAYSFAVGGKPAETIFLSHDQAIVRVHGDVAPGTYPLHVVNTAGKVAAVGPAVTVRDGALRLRSVAPSCGTTDGGIAVLLNGEGFEEGASVTFNGVAATAVELLDANALRATVPAGATGAARVVVTNPDGTEAIVHGGFRYVSPFDPNGCTSSTRVRGVRH